VSFESHARVKPDTLNLMSMKAATVTEVPVSDAKASAIIAQYLQEMAAARERMKISDSRIRRADRAIERSLNEARAILRHVQATH
jgi:hypothetical protein